MADWLFFTNHLHVLAAIAQRPDSTLRELARAVGISERATHRIVVELEEHGYIQRTRVGARNSYEVKEMPLRHPLHEQHTSGEVIRLLTGLDSGSDGTPPAAAASERLFRDVFDAAPAGIVVADASGRFIQLNRSFCAILGYRRDELIGHCIADFTHPEDVPADLDAITKLVTGEQAEAERETRYIRRDGTLTWVMARMATVSEPLTGAPRIVAHVLCIDDLRLQQRALALAEERFRIAFDNAPIGMALVAPDGRWLKVNRSLSELTGYSEQDLLTRSFQSITHPDDLDADLGYVAEVLAGERRTYQLEKRYRHADGHVIWVNLSVALVRDDRGDPLYFIAQVEDVSERKLRERTLESEAERLAVLASSDSLTGLANRRAWDRAIADEMEAARVSGAPLTIALIDLDGLKEINDTRGHQAGNEALRATAATLRASVRGSDLVARFGGDEFGVLLPGGDAGRMHALTERMLGGLPDGQAASAGVATWDGQESASALLERADRALYVAKRSGKSRVVSAEPAALAAAAEIVRQTSNKTLDSIA